jgi:hypothetical protein
MYVERQDIVADCGDCSTNAMVDGDWFPVVEELARLSMALHSVFKER